MGAALEHSGYRRRRFGLSRSAIARLAHHWLVSTRPCPFWPTGGVHVFVCRTIPPCPTSDSRSYRSRRPWRRSPLPAEFGGGARECSGHHCRIASWPRPLPVEAVNSTSPSHTPFVLIPARTDGGTRSGIRVVLVILRVLSSGRERTTTAPALVITPLAAASTRLRSPGIVLIATPRVPDSGRSPPAPRTAEAHRRHRWS